MNSWEFNSSWFQPVIFDVIIVIEFRVNSFQNWNVLDGDLPTWSRIKLEVFSDWMKTSQWQSNWGGSAAIVSRSSSDVAAETAENSTISSTSSSSSSSSGDILSDHLTTVGSILPVGGVYILGGHLAAFEFSATCNGNRNCEIETDEKKKMSSDDPRWPRLIAVFLNRRSHCD